MTYADPFADTPAPAEEAQQAPVAAAPTQAPAAPVASTVQQVQHSTDGVSATFKFGGAYSDPWVVVKGADAGEVNAKLHDPQFKELMDFVQRVAGLYGNAEKPAQPAQGGGGGQQQSRAPQAAQQAPNGETRHCAHGEMVFKSGVSKSSGKPYKLFSCTAPRDQQCKAQFLN